MNKLLGKYNLAKTTQKENKSVNSPLSIKSLSSLSKNFPMKKNPRQTASLVYSIKYPRGKHFNSTQTQKIEEYYQKVLVII